MTEELQKWVLAKAVKPEVQAGYDGIHWRDGAWESCHPLSVRAAEFWLRAFCDAIQAKANEGRSASLCDVHGVSCFAREGKAFEELRKELLGQ